MIFSVFLGAPCRIRTYDLHIRSVLLYPAELMAHGSKYPYRRKPFVSNGQRIL